jgi:NAD(P)H dehydrogenase (quinone)
MNYLTVSSGINKYFNIKGKSMKIYSILVHPERDSLNGKLFDQALEFFNKKKYQVETLDLYRSEFNPMAIYEQLTSDKELNNYAHKWFTADARDLLPEFSQREIERLKSSDILYLQTPIWWWGLPALMKAYIENVFIYNVLFSLENEHSRDHGDATVFKLLRGKKMILSVTTGSSEKFISEHFGNVDSLLAPIKARFGFVGYDIFPVYHSGALSGKTEKVNIENFKEYLSTLKLR